MPTRSDLPEFVREEDDAVDEHERDEAGGDQRPEPRLGLEQALEAARPGECDPQRCAFDGERLGAENPEEIGAEDDGGAAEVIPGGLRVDEDAAQVEELDAGDGEWDKDGLDDGAAVADEPEELLAVEGVAAEADGALGGRGSGKLGCGEVSAEPPLGGP